MKKTKHDKRTAEEDQRRSTNAITTPLWDLVCCGGASIVAVVAIFLCSVVAPDHRVFTAGIQLRDIVVLTVLLNFPHFMASYRLLYQSREQVEKHSWASVYIPAILVALVIYALVTPSSDPENPEFANGAVVEILTILSALLLAWHYTGQGWGMTASFAFLGGLRFEKWERISIRLGYHSLMVFHIAWALRWGAQSTSTIYFTNALADYLVFIELFYNLSVLGALASIPIGMVGFCGIRYRTGRWPPIRSVVPWVAIFLWYLLIWRYPKTFLCLQLFHALQYLIFPLRVEVNRHSTQASASKQSLGYAVWIYALLTVAGVIVFWSPRAAVLLGDNNYVLQSMVASIVNIHHYFTDGAIWKIRNPQVRKDLFSHLSPQH